jgi:hypothetical protein
MSKAASMRTNTMRTNTMRTAGSIVIFLLFAILFAAPTWAQADVKDRMVED